jgi:hypothetical protein
VATQIQLTAFFRPLARVLLVVGGNATLQAAQLAFWGCEAHTLWGRWAGGGFAFGFCAVGGRHDQLIQVKGWETSDYLALWTR